MKKISLCLCAVLFLTATAFARPIQQNAFLNNFYLGGVFGMEKADIQFDDTTFAWGHAGVEVGFSGHYFVTDYIGLGLDFHYAGFQGSHKNIWDRSTIPYSQLKMNLDMETFNLMGAGRINFNPRAPIRFYMPLATGLVVAHSKFKYKDSHAHTDLRASDTSLNWGGYVGLGMEYDLYEGALTLGLETRYNFYRYNYRDLAQEIQADNHPNKHTYHYMSILMVASFQ